MGQQRGGSGGSVGVVGGREYLGRDHLIVALIGGVTKAGVAVDRRKERDRLACRKAYGKGRRGDE